MIVEVYFYSVDRTAYAPSIVAEDAQGGFQKRLSILILAARTSP